MFSEVNDILKSSIQLDELQNFDMILLNSIRFVAINKCIILFKF